MKNEDILNHIKTWVRNFTPAEGEPLRQQLFKYYD